MSRAPLTFQKAVPTRLSILRFDHVLHAEEDAGQWDVWTTSHRQKSEKTKFVNMVKLMVKQRKVDHKDK